MPLSMCVIVCCTICMYGKYVCCAKAILYHLQDNLVITKTFRRITKTERIFCVVECAKDPWCLAVVYDEELRTCDVSSYAPDEIIAWNETKPGSKLYYQKSTELTTVSGIAAWQSSVNHGKSGSLTIDKNFGSVHAVCFHSADATGNYLIVELEKTSNLLHVDILFRSDLPTYAERQRNTNITVLVAHSKAELDANQSIVCGHYDGPPVYPSHEGRVKCAPNTTGKYVKFLHNIYSALNICEVSFYVKM